MELCLEICDVAEDRSARLASMHVAFGFTVATYTSLGIVRYFLEGDSIIGESLLRHGHEVSERIKLVESISC